MNWSPEQQRLAEKYRSLNEIPAEDRRYKCHTCHFVVDENGTLIDVQVNIKPEASVAGVLEVVSR